MSDKTSDGQEISRKSLPLLQSSYREVLDAVKHQDDKIGRLFTGIAFLTAAALAMANLGGPESLRREYLGWGPTPPAVLNLAAYLLLVLVAVTILLSSLGTPLRIPGLHRGRVQPASPAGPPKPISQIYFGEISRVPQPEWRRKWSAKTSDLKTELAESLVGEVYNLATRTQFKYGRMNEAIALFNFALLFLATTMIFCVSSLSTHPEAAPLGQSDSAHLPVATQWALAGAIGTFFFLQLLSQVRYTRQTLDEILGCANRVSASRRYLWVISASVWILLVTSGQFTSGLKSLVLWAVGFIATSALVAGTYAQVQNLVPNKRFSARIWTGPAVAIVAGFAITAAATLIQDSDQAALLSYALGVFACSVLTIFALASPSLAIRRNAKRALAQMQDNKADS